MPHFEPFSEIYNDEPTPRHTSTPLSMPVVLIATGVAIGALVGSALVSGIRTLADRWDHLVGTSPLLGSSSMTSDDESHNSSSADPSATLMGAGSLSDLPYSSSHTHIYLLTEADLTALMAQCSAGVDLDETLLTLWLGATRVNLDEMDEDTDLFEVIAAAVEIDPETYHALIFTYEEEAS